jgi:hypothetical protein
MGAVFSVLLGTHAKSTYDTLNDISTHIIMDSISTCTTDSTQNVNITFKNNRGPINIPNLSTMQKTTVDINCIMKSDKQNEIQDKISQALAQQVTAKGQAVLDLFGSSTATAQARIKTSLSNSVQANTTQELTTNVIQSSSLTFEDNVGGITIGTVTMGQSADLTALALLKTRAYTSVIKDVATKIDQGVLSVSKNPIGDVIKSMGTFVGRLMTIPVMVILCIVLLAIGVAILYKFVLKDILEKTDFTKLTELAKVVKSVKSVK